MPLTDAPTKDRRRRRSSEEVADRILRAAREAFGEGGYAGATTAAIARRAEVTEAQLYRSFGSKAALFREAVFKPLAAHLAEFQAGVAARRGDHATERELAADYIAELQRFLGDNAPLLLALLLHARQPSGDAIDLPAIDSLADYFDVGAATRRARGGGGAMAPELMVRVSFAAVLGYVLFHEALFPRDTIDLAAADIAMRRFVLDGIAGVPALTASSNG